jgi:tripartite motif-containing protein 71
VSGDSFPITYGKRKHQPLHDLAPSIGKNQTMPNKIYVADYFSDKILIYNLDGTIYTYILGFNSPSDVYVYKEEIYVADTLNHLIQVFDIEGNWKRQWYATKPGSSNTWQVYNIRVALGTDGQSDEVFATVAGDPPIWNQIAVYDINGVFKRDWGPYGYGQAQLQWAWGISVTKTKIYVSDYRNHRIQVFNIAGDFIATWGTQGTGDGQFRYPRHSSIYKNELYIVDSSNQRVQVFDLDGNFKRKWGEYGNNPGQLNEPAGISAAGGLVFVSCFNYDKVQSFDRNGVFKKKYNNNIITPYGLHYPAAEMIQYLPVLGIG